MPTAAAKTPLSDEQLSKAVTDLRHWHTDGGMLVRDYLFPSFAAAMRFVNAVAGLAEEQNHHPEIEVRFDCVRLALRSHDVDALTARDLRLARAVNELTTRPGR